MKQVWLKKILILPLAFAVVAATAQRNEQGGARGNGNQQGGARQSTGNNQQRQSSSNAGNRQSSGNQQRQSSPAGGNQGNAQRGNAGNQSSSTRRTGPGVFRTPSNGGNPVRQAYHGAPRFVSGVPAYGQRVTRLSTNYRTIAFRGVNYRYYNGVFYNPIGAAFQVIFPPVGIYIDVLPLGYRRIFVGTNPYYYYNGVFYNNYATNQYVVVDPPLGAKLPELPIGATLVTINGANYYESNGTYYVEEYNINNEVLYTVVGVHGVLNDAYAATPVLQQNAIRTLPANCRKVNINGQVLYLAPDGAYYQEVLDAEGLISYQIVGGVSN